jgi:Fic family protein
LSVDNTLCMIGMPGSRKLDREKLDSLSNAHKIRELEKEKSFNQRLETLILRKFKETGLEDRMKGMDGKLDKLTEKLNEFMYMYESNCRQKNSPTAKKVKVKEMIKLLLSQHGSLSAPNVSKFLNLSRTRCSEYLKEMENSGALSSELRCRKRFYRIRQ